MPAAVAATEQQLDRITAQLNIEEITAEILRVGDGVTVFQGQQNAARQRDTSTRAAAFAVPVPLLCQGAKPYELCLRFKYNSCCLLPLTSCLCPGSVPSWITENIKVQKEGSKERVPWERRL